METQTQIRYQTQQTKYTDVYHGTEILHKFILQKSEKCMYMTFYCPSLFGEHYTTAGKHGTWCKMNIITVLT